MNTTVLTQPRLGDQHGAWASAIWTRLGSQAGHHYHLKCAISPTALCSRQQMMSSEMRAMLNLTLELSVACLHPRMAESKHTVPHSAQRLSPA